MQSQTTMVPGRAASVDQDRSRASRACQACRTSKVRCRRPHDDQPCVRCSEFNRRCVPREESNKRQKRVDGRFIDGIEARLDVLTEVLEDRDGNASATEATSAERTTTLEPQPATTSLKTNTTGDPSSTLSDEYSTARVEQCIRDTIDEETTSMVFSHFIENMLQHFPFMAFRPHATAEVMLRTTPTLLLAILDTAGDGFYDTNVSRRLRKLLVKVYSTCLLDTNLYRVSLLQAIMISVVWHKDLEAPQAGEQMDIFQISHAAANMAMVMGMGKGNRWTSLEVRRLWLACYHICSSASMALQTPNIMRWTRHMDECLEVLSTSDKVLCAHIRLQHILEEFETQLSSASGSTAVEITQRVAKRQLSEWYAGLNVWNDSLNLSQQFAMLYIHEPATTAMPTTGSPPKDNVTRTTISASRFTECLATAQKSLDAFLSLDMSLIRALPTSYFVQITHTAIIIVNLRFAAAELPNYGNLDVKADHYFERLVKKFSGWGALWSAQKLAHTFRRLRKMLRRCDSQGLASNLAWLGVWTLLEAPSVEFAGQINTITDHSGSGEGDPIAQGIESAGRATLLRIEEDVLAWSRSGMDQSNVIQNTVQDALPSASLDATQLIDWFGTDLDTSTFDFDGNLQSMVQFFD